MYYQIKLIIFLHKIQYGIYIILYLTLYRKHNIQINFLQ